MLFDFLKRVFVDEKTWQRDHDLEIVELHHSTNEVHESPKPNVQYAPLIQPMRSEAYSIDKELVNIYTQAEYEHICNGTIIGHDVVIRNGMVVSLHPVTFINGDLGLSDCKLTTLAPLEAVSGNVWCSFSVRRPELSTLGTLKKIGGDARFRYTLLESLGDLEYVGGSLSLRDTQVLNLGKLKYVGGDLLLPKRLEGIVNLDSVKVEGSVSYWNDSKTHKIPGSDDSSSCLKKSPVPVPYWPQNYIYPDHSMLSEPRDIQEFYRLFADQFRLGVLLDTEGYSNYYFQLMYDIQKSVRNPETLASKYSILSQGYPKLKSYCNSILIESYLSYQQYARAWDIEKGNQYVAIKRLYSYIDKLGDDIFDGEIAAKIAGTNCLTSFGKAHVNEVLRFFINARREFEQTRGCRFYDVFFQGELGYHPVNGAYEPEYYKEFFRLKESDYEYYKAIGSDAYHMRRLDDILLVNHAVETQLRNLLIAAEDMYRESIGLPKIGEGWINETALFHKIQEHYNGAIVVHHGHPKWLGKQHLDIYFKELNIGIEYQGIQHYEPVDYFGGEEGFKKSQERDKRKQQLCEDNKCPLIYVNEGYDFIEVVSRIDEAIKRQTCSDNHY